jgi:uncharacterized protein (DUF849 family)
VIQACLNGARTSGVPVTPEQLAADAAACVAEGAQSLHLHVRDASGAESLQPTDVAGTLAAVRQAAPGVEVSLSTGLWITGGDVVRRYELVAAWDETPELVSLNLSEDGWQRLAALLTERGIGIEAGLATTDDAEALTRSELAPFRVLVEVEGGVAEAQSIDDVLDGAGHAAPRLHHGYGAATWPVITAARARGHDVRIGLEDTLELPDGAPASNAELVRYCLNGS